MAKVNVSKKIIIAEPNGAGKTTFAREYLPSGANCPIFINADLIAADLAPFAPKTASINAGRLMLNEIKAIVKATNNFMFETMLSGNTYAKHIADKIKQGDHISLIFLSLPT